MDRMAMRMRVHEKTMNKREYTVTFRFGPGEYLRRQIAYKNDCDALSLGQRRRRPDGVRLATKKEIKEWLGQELHNGELVLPELPERE